MEKSLSGRGPNGGRETVQHWTRACDDLKGPLRMGDSVRARAPVKGAGDIDWFNAKRQLLGVAHPP